MEYSKSDMVTLKIEDIGVDGEGIGKLEGYIFFVKDAVIGDVVEAKVMKAKKNYAYARLVKVIQPSCYRTEPKCQYHKQCGGCQIQALSYDAQLTYKQKKVRNHLIHIGGFAPEMIDSVLEPIVGMEYPWHYRNKAQFPVGMDKDANPITGFYAGRTHDIIANTDCVLGIKENQQILETVLQYMRDNKVSAYDEKSAKGCIRHILIRKGFTSGEIMVCIVANGRELPQEKQLVEGLKDIPGVASISVNINKEKTNVILGEHTRVIWGKDTITDVIHRRTLDDINAGKDGRDLSSEREGISFAISPLSFYQVNPIQTEKLYSLALEYAGLSGEETVWDLYCGIGTISLFMAQKAKKVYGIEVIPQAIEDAKRNAENNGIGNVEFFVGKAEEVLPAYYEKSLCNQSGKDASTDNMASPDVICVDPPRKGCDKLCLDTIVKMSPKRIVYVSCDSATLARDLKYLCENGYELTRVRPVDQFSQTVHVETVVLLSQLRQKPDDYIDVDIDVAELEGTSAETKATYEKIKKYVAEHNDGMKVSNLYIAQVKRKCGIELAENFNLPKSEDARQPRCPKEKEEAIVEALKAFQMI